MFVGEINVPAASVRSVGPATAKLLGNLGIGTVGDLLTYWPRDWEDRTVRLPLSHFDRHAKLSVLATVIAHDWFGFGRMKTLKIIIKDEEGTAAELVCFNRPFLEKQFPPGTAVSVYGGFRYAFGSLQSSAFDIEIADESPARVLPVYPLTEGLGQQQIRKIIGYALDGYAKGLDSELPESVRAVRGLPSKQEILFLMHRPGTMADALRAREALIFEELFLFEFAIGRRSLERRGKLPDAEGLSNGTRTGREQPEPALTPLQGRLLSRLPFSLTPDQRTVLAEINRDLADAAAMARLLQGDVGSGKTLVSFLASLAVIEAGGQVALLAPTELLARQHAENAARLLEPTGIRLAFLTGNLKAAGRTRLLAELERGNIDLVIGTHALFSANVAYKNLRLAIIDEQHRFGVRQRSAIQEKGMAQGERPPHLLMMSATPIPRTLALSVFGDLDISVIRTMPPGRKPIITHLARQGNEKKVYDFIKRELESGRQAYFVYPLIDPSDAAELKSATEMYDRLREAVFPGIPCALIHSRVREEEQRGIMEGFRKGEIRILVATSVVEVGVDVANATCMTIEHAERFGLSALHQMRGRVGRGEAQSYCFLVYDKLTEEGKARLKVMHETTDGFLIAEEDLKIRGPGEITGIRQSGYIAFSLADPIRDRGILMEARKAAFDLLTAERDGS